MSCIIGRWAVGVAACSASSGAYLCSLFDTLSASLSDAHTGILLFSATPVLKQSRVAFYYHFQVLACCALSVVTVRRTAQINTDTLTTTTEAYGTQNHSSIRLRVSAMSGSRSSKQSNPTHAMTERDECTFILALQCRFIWHCFCVWPCYTLCTDLRCLLWSNSCTLSVGQTAVGCINPRQSAIDITHRQQLAIAAANRWVCSRCVSSSQTIDLINSCSLLQMLANIALQSILSLLDRLQSL